LFLRNFAISLLRIKKILLSFGSAQVIASGTSTTLSIRTLNHLTLFCFSHTNNCGTSARDLNAIILSKLGK